MQSTYQLKEDFVRELKNVTRICFVLLKQVIQLEEKKAKVLKAFLRGFKKTKNPKLKENFSFTAVVIDVWRVKTSAILPIFDKHLFFLKVCHVCLFQ